MFFITCMQNLPDNSNIFAETGAQRTFGFTETLNDAERKLNENYLDMHEYLYKYAVVEKIETGIHPEVLEEVWFKWNEEKKGFYRIKKPDECSCFCNFALG